MAVTVVADIGGTSSRWGVLRPGSEALIIEGLPGFNPAVGVAGTFVEMLRARFTAEGVGADEVFAYGAGCGSQDRAFRMGEALLAVWPDARVDVASDLVGAAHGLLGARSGLVLILGTGMNAGWYDGGVVHQPMPSLGYILGDEGSATDMGKRLLRAALYKRLPADLMEAIFPDGLSTAEVVEHLYRGASPQAWLGAYAGRLASFQDHPWVRDLILSGFSALAQLLMDHFDAAQRADVVATGSVAFGLNGLLRSAFAEAGMRISDVQQSPLPGLLRYRSLEAR